MMPLHSRKLPVTFDEKKIDSLFVELDQCHLPGAAVGIAINGKGVYRKGFGLASMDLPLALTPAMRVRIGSVSKNLTGFAFLRLCEEGRANLDDPIGKYLPELHPVTHKVTMRQLMGNNSGLRDATDLCLQFSGIENGRISTSDILDYYRGSVEVNAPPGATHIYNNGGWIILSVIMERITEQPLEEVLWGWVFRPIGMYDSMLRRWDAEFVPNSSSTHALAPSGKFERVELIGGIDCVGAGSIVSTVDDMLRWLTHMDAPHIGSPATWELMKSPQKLRNGASTEYSLGLGIQHLRGVDIISHSGGGFGNNAQMIKVPQAGLDVVVLCNRADKSAVDLADKILEACLPTLGPVDEPYAGPFPEGVYRSRTTGRAIQLTREDTGYFCSGQKIPIASIDGHFIPVTVDSKGVLRPCNGVFAGIAITPVGDPMNPTALKLEDFGTPDELVAVKRSVTPNVSAIVGKYYSAETGTQATIWATDDEPRMKLVGRFGSTEHSLHYLADGVWRNRMKNRWVVPPWGFVLFDAVHAEFGFYTYLTRNARFVRVQ